MSGCEHPGCEAGGLTVTCNYCESSFCGKHRLPEKHDCKAFETAQAVNAGGGGQQTMDRRDRERRARKANKRKCVDCGDWTTADHERCRDCRFQADVSSRTSTPDVTVSKGANDSEPADVGGPTLLERVMREVRGRVRVIATRIRAGIRSVTGIGAIALFVLGVYALVRPYQVPEVQILADVGYLYIVSLPHSVTFLGVEVPAVAGLTPMETLAVAGFLSMIGGLMLSFKLIFGRTTPI